MIFFSAQLRQSTDYRTDRYQSLQPSVPNTNTTKKDMFSFDDIQMISRILKEQSIDINKYLKPQNENLEKIKNLVKQHPDLVQIQNKLYNLAAYAPDKFDKITNSGLFEAIDKKQIDTDIMEGFTVHTDFTEGIYKDLKIVKEGKSIVPEFSDKKNAFSNTKIGDVAEVNGKMYINEGEKLSEWKMTKEKYLELFPPIKRFATKQQNLGNCYFVSSLADSMEHPKSRINIYKSFEQKGDDITVTIKGYKDYGGSYTYKNGELNLDTGKKHLLGAKGLQMYENTYKLVSLRQRESDKTPLVPPKDMNPLDLAKRIESGLINTTMGEIHGLEQKVFKKYHTYDVTHFEDVPENINNEVCDIWCLSDHKNVEQTLNKYANKEDYCIGFGLLLNSIREKRTAEYNLHSSHAYSLKGYDAKNKTIKLNDPHNCAINIEIPLEMIKDSIIDMTVTGFKKNGGFSAIKVS